MLEKDWDIVVFTDGSGMQWGMAGGCAALLMDRELGVREWVCLGVTDGTVNFMELLPILIAIRQHYYKLGGSKRARVKTVDIYSDSELIVRQGKGEYRRKASKELWMAIEALCEFGGYVLRWHWIPRNKYLGNISADSLARLAYLTMKKIRAELPDPYTLEIL